MKKSKILIGLIIIVICITAINWSVSNASEDSKCFVDLTNLKLEVNGTESDIIRYTQDDYEQFLSDYNSGNLPEIYITEFLYDGAGMVKTPDLDDFIEKESNSAKIKILSLTVINVNTTGNIEFTGEIKGAMIAVNTNGISDDINLILNGVTLDTDSKKAPAIYVYNKDINYTEHKVTIKTVAGTRNYIEGGKFKKVSLMDKDSLSNYSSYYKSTSYYEYEYEDDEGNEQTKKVAVSELYNSYSNYYGIYTSEEINNILFARTQADNEDLADGDPYYYYKGSGAISSDIDLYFEGEGYLEVKSKNKEGIETKGNLIFSGGTGDYVIYAQDDCLNTTTSKSEGTNVRNTLTIDVNSLIAIVDLSADEGDAIDSNGTLTINGGKIVALAKPGQDAGLDSEDGTFINGGTVVATGDMYDQVSNQSSQNFMALSFNNKPTDDTIITLLDSDNNTTFSFKTDRTYSYLIYSSPELTNGTYSLYKNGTIEGTNIIKNLNVNTEEINEISVYQKGATYTKGTIQGYSQTGIQGGMPGGGTPGENMNGDTPPQMPNGENQGPQNGETSPEIPNENNENREGQTPPDGNEGDRPEMPSDDNNNMQSGNQTASNKEFVISGISNLFSGVGAYTENTEQQENNNQENNNQSEQQENNNTNNDNNEPTDQDNNNPENNEQSDNTDDNSSSNNQTSGTSDNDSNSNSSNQTSGTSNNTNSNTNSSNNNSNTKTSGTSSSTSGTSTSNKDTTTANTNLPYAGSERTFIIPAIILLTGLTIFFYIKYKRI